MTSIVRVQLQGTLAQAVREELARRGLPVAGDGVAWLEATCLIIEQRADSEVFEFLAGPRERAVGVVVVWPNCEPSVRARLLRAGATEIVVELDANAIVDATLSALERVAFLEERLSEHEVASPSSWLRSEDERRESERRFAELADNIAQLAWMTDATGFIHWYNRRWFEFTGTTLQQMQGWGWQKVHHPEHVDRVTEKFQHHLSIGEPWEDIFPLRRHDGQYRWFLSRAFPLRGSSGEIVSWFGTNTDITAQRQAEESLREADRRKDEFIAILAHELRNPLTPVRNAVQLLKGGSLAPASFERALDVIERQVSQMARLIDDLLDVSRLARQQLRVELRPCDFAAIATQTAEDYRSYFEEKGITLEIERSAESLIVLGDPVRLSQMVGNLLHNAARFTDREGTVRLGFVRTGDGLAQVLVVDSGAGIAQEMLERLFDPFFQEEQDLARSRGGLGLGLSLTRGFAELHGGSVSAWSGGRGRGSTFQITVPLFDESSGESRASRHESRATFKRHPGAALKVLIVEDNADAAETLGALFLQAGHDVRVAFDGEEALETLGSFAPQVIISDLGLPGAYDGYELARVVRADAANQGVFLVALSGYANEDARARAREVGYDAHVAKPPDFQRLLELVTSGTPGLSMVVPPNVAS